MSGQQELGPGRFSAFFTFQESFIGFQGHFPGHPVLPGVCLVQAALILSEALRRQKMRLTEIVNAKFFAPVLPGQSIEISCEFIEESQSMNRVKVWVSHQGTKVAQMTLAVSG